MLNSCSGLLENSKNKGIFRKQPLLTFTPHAFALLPEDIWGFKDVFCFRSSKSHFVLGSTSTLMATISLLAVSVFKTQMPGLTAIMQKH